MVVIIMTEAAHFSLGLARKIIVAIGSIDINILIWLD